MMLLNVIYWIKILVLHESHYANTRCVFSVSLFSKLSRYYIYGKVDGWQNIYIYIYIHTSNLRNIGLSSFDHTRRFASFYCNRFLHRMLVFAWQNWKAIPFWLACPSSEFLKFARITYQANVFNVGNVLICILSYSI